MYNPHTCLVPTFYPVNPAQTQPIVARLADGTFVPFDYVSGKPTIESNQNQNQSKNELHQTEFAFGSEFASKSNLTPESHPQITPRLYQTQLFNNVNKPMHKLPWGEEALAF